MKDPKHNDRVIGLTLMKDTSYWYRKILYIRFSNRNKMSLHKILIIDDETKIRSLLTRILQLEGFEIIQAENLKAGWKKLVATAPEVVLCDVKLPDGNGVDFAREVKEKFPSVEIILLTAYGNISDGVQAIKNGAFDYITKGDDNGKILPLLYRALERVRLNKESLEIVAGELPEINSNNLIGNSSIFQQTLALVRKVAPTNATVLLTGETGTGKEVFANAIHKTSLRGNKNFIAINCSTFSKDLLESELFGHKAGAFTGAVKDQKGLLEEAHQGTIFLDEIGEMALDLQAKLLRVLESGEFIKIGETKPSKVDVRIIAATNRNFEKEIAQGTFREDLYYRISVFQITLPALRERVQDIGLMVRQFITHFNKVYQKNVKETELEALRLLENYSWPGNIRELKNTIERTMILTENDILTKEDFPLYIQTYAGNELNKEKAMELAAIEKQHIQKVLLFTKGNKTKTAELLGIALTTLYRKISEYGLN